MATYRCDECGALSIGLCVPPGNVSKANADVLVYMSQLNVGLEWLPAQAARREFPDVPQHIADAASEAHSCHAIHSYRAAVLMARSVIEATAKDKGITNGVLATKIDELHTSGFIRELVREQAHEVRFLGNEMAHGDFVAPVTDVESAETLELMAEVLAEVYQAPARLAARRRARMAKAQTTP